MPRGQIGPIERGRSDAWHVELQLRPLLQRLDDAGEAFAARLIELGTAGREVDEIHLLTTTKEPAEECKGCGDRFLEQIEHRSPHDGPDAELRIIETARDRE